MKNPCEEPDIQDILKLNAALKLNPNDPVAKSALAKYGMTKKSLAKGCKIGAKAAVFAGQAASMASSAAGTAANYAGKAALGTLNAVMRASYLGGKPIKKKSSRISRRHSSRKIKKIRKTRRKSSRKRSLTHRKKLSKKSRKQSRKPSRH